MWQKTVVWMWQKVWTAIFSFSEGLSKLPLWAFTQMDEWMKSSGFGKRSIWCAGFEASVFRVKILLHVYVTYFRWTYSGTYWCRKGGWQREKQETTVRFKGWEGTAEMRTEVAQQTRTDCFPVCPWSTPLVHQQCEGRRANLSRSPLQRLLKWLLRFDT